MSRGSPGGPGEVGEAADREPVPSPARASAWLDTSIPRRSPASPSPLTGLQVGRLGVVRPAAPVVRRPVGGPVPRCPAAAGRRRDHPASSSARRWSAAVPVTLHGRRELGSRRRIASERISPPLVPQYRDRPGGQRRAVRRRSVSTAAAPGGQRGGHEVVAVHQVPGSAATGPPCARRRPQGIRGSDGAPSAATPLRGEFPQLDGGGRPRGKTAALRGFWSERATRREGYRARGRAVGGATLRGGQPLQGWHRLGRCLTEAGRVGQVGWRSSWNRARRWCRPPVLEITRHVRGSWPQHPG